MVGNQSPVSGIDACIDLDPFLFLLFIQKTHRVMLRCGNVLLDLYK